MLSLLGAGGMGEVYRARDTRLGREVAIKVLPGDRMADENRRQRFVQEARAASALNHPNIVTIYEIESAAGIDFIVMEYVPGKSLDALIPGQGMRVPEVLRIAIPMADALARAHARGIVHRDLKPANVMVSTEGVVKVLDFGLAKLVSSEEVSDEQETVTRETAAGPLSQPGTVAGTAGYMSPEQATAGKVDSRSDVFAFGAVLYEMVTGRRAFAGGSTAETLAAVVKEQPKAPSAVVPSVPRDLEKLILRCLQKDPDRRFQHMLDVKVELNEIKEESDSAPAAAAAVPARRQTRRWLAAGFVGVAGVLVVASVGWWRLGRSSHASASAPLLTRLTSEPGVQTDPALSPDGKLVVYAAEAGGNVDLWVKQVAGGTPVRITDDPLPDWQPDYSPDGSRIVFRSERDGGGLYVASALGGTAQRIASFGWKPRFSPDGSRVLLQSSPIGVGRIFVLDVGWGEPRPVSREPMQNWAWWAWSACWHPDGKRVSFRTFVGDRPTRTSVWRTVSLADGAFRDTDLSAVVPIWPSLEWAPSGDRVFIEGTAGQTTGLWRARIDPTTLRLSDVEPVTVGASQQSGFRLSHDGRSAAFAVSQARHHIWSLSFDAATGYVKGEGEGLYEEVQSSQCELSRDGARLACGAVEGLWVGNISTRTRVPLFADQAADLRGGLPTLSPDGRHVAYHRSGADGDARNGVYVATIDGRDEYLVRAHAPRASFPYGWSPDGRWVVGTSPRGPSEPESQVWMAPAFDGASAVTQVLTSSTTEDLWNSRLSPDGRWLAFSAVRDDGGSSVWVAPRSGGERKRMGSGDWDDVPRWSPDGRILFFLPSRAGFRNVWGIPFDPQSGRARGEPFQVTRFERPSRVIPGSFSFHGVSRDRLVLGLADQSGSVWRVENIDR